jgi:hypothetical protein
VPFATRLKAEINHGFDYLDVDGDGRPTEQDHVLMGRRAAQALGYAPSSAEEQHILDAYLTSGATCANPTSPTEARSSLASSSSPPPAPSPTIRRSRETVGVLAEDFLVIADTDPEAT